MNGTSDTRSPGDSRQHTLVILPIWSNANCHAPVHSAPYSPSHSPVSLFYSRSARLKYVLHRFLSKMDAEEPIVVDPSYSLDDAIRSGVAAEAAYAYLDLGPVDTLDRATLEAEYDLFFGSSPLSSASSSPMPSRSASPAISALDIETQCNTQFGAFPSSSPSSSRPASLVLEEPCPKLSSPADAYHDPEPFRSNKATKRRIKSHANRRRKRQETRTQRDSNSLPYPNSHKIIANAKSVGTSYDVNDIPSASSGFIALPDGGDRGSKVHESRELLEGEKFKLIEWNGMYVPFPNSVDYSSHVLRVVRAIVDKDGRIIAVLAGCPNDSNWESVHRSGHVALQSARKRCRFPKKAKDHRRGSFPALSTGISFGGGQKVGVLNCSPKCHGPNGAPS